MNIVPTLNFGGNCREAIKMYEKAFNGKIVCLITYRDANDPAYMPLLSEEQKDYIYHAELILDNHSLVMYDHDLIPKDEIWEDNKNVRKNNKPKSKR